MNYMREVFFEQAPVMQGSLRQEAQRASCSPRPDKLKWFAYRRASRVMPKFKHAPRDLESFPRMPLLRVPSCRVLASAALSASTIDFRDFALVGASICVGRY